MYTVLGALIVVLSTVASLHFILLWADGYLERQRTKSRQERSRFYNALRKAAGK